MVRKKIINITKNTYGKEKKDKISYKNNSINGKEKIIKNQKILYGKDKNNKYLLRNNCVNALIPISFFITFHYHNFYVKIVLGTTA